MLNFETIKSFYKKGLWSAQLVEMSARKGILTAAEVKEILEEKE